MRIKWSTGVAAIGIFLVIGSILFIAFTAPVAAKTGMEGRVLPSFDLLLPDSVTHFNTANIPAGKPFIVFGFDPFCTHCQAETLDIINNIQRLKGVPIYYVTPYEFWKMKSFYNHYKLAQYSNITIGMDKQDYFLTYFKLHTIPYTAVFDAQKRLKKAFVGETDAKSLAKAIEE